MTKTTKNTYYICTVCNGIWRFDQFSEDLTCIAAGVDANNCKGCLEAGRLGDKFHGLLQLHEKDREMVELLYDIQLPEHL